MIGTIERLDFKMLLNPFKEQFDLLTFSVKFSDSKGVEFSVVGNETINDTRFKIFVSNQPKRFGILSERFVSGKSSQFITYHTSLLIHRESIFDSILNFILGSGDKKCPFFVYMIEQTKKIYKSFVHIKSEAVVATIHRTCNFN